ncbi:hypothetical protein GCM10023116_47520 [Kistimonas scapharcae]|uniref:Uncharacterized protein n=1 Tax=Kistimonas scapharcae TaxID=1036133 RepID=A0ABP8V8A6_9GAMM
MKKERNIFSIIESIPDDRVFLDDGHKTITYGQLKDRTRQLERDLSPLEGKICAITSDSKMSLACYLPVLSKVCRGLYLQPSGLSSEYLTDLYKEIGVSYRLDLRDNKFYLEKISDINSKEVLASGIILSTSGTSGQPKVLSYSLSSLMSKTKVDINRGSDFNWGLCYDLNRFAGLQVYLQAVSSGSTITPLKTCMPVAEQVDMCIRTGVNAISATPSYWRQLVMAPQLNKLNMRLITLGGEIADQSILTALRKAFPETRIVHIYASTEAGVGFSVKDGKEGFSLDRVQLENTNLSLKVIDNVLFIRSNSSAESILYGKIDIDGEGFIDTGDLVEKKEDRYIFKGRVSGTINVGGNKVLPEEIEKVLNSHPAVLISRVYPKKNSILGALVCAEVVLNAAVDNASFKNIDSQLKSCCKELLEPFKVPAIIKQVDNIEVSTAGKIIRSYE